jgi:hypothetical protein
MSGCVRRHSQSVPPALITPFEQKAVLAAMKRDELLAILPDGIISL